MRLDQWLVANHFFESREKARREIELGHVIDARTEAPLRKPAWKVPAEYFSVRIRERLRFVSRAGEKLEGFLEEEGLFFSEKVVLDVGASTGGFTECVLRRKAKRVISVDVGTSQLHSSLLEDPRVQVLEQTDIRELDFKSLDSKPDWVVVDVSFISLTKILPKLFNELSNAEFILLFKPQFESGPLAHKTKGIVSEETRAESLKAFRQFLISGNAKIVSERDSKLTGAEGNQETFFWVRISSG